MRKLGRVHGLLGRGRADITRVRAKIESRAGCGRRVARDRLRQGAKPVPDVIQNWWRQGMMASAKAQCDGIKAFSEP